jgi:hypothetical protein
MFRRRFWPVAVLALLLPIVSCDNGGECDKCDSDDDCSSGFICVTFRDENGNPLQQKRCGAGNGSVTCRTFR